MKYYEVNVNFAGFVGADNQYDMYASDEDEAIESALDEAKEDLEVLSVEDVGDGEYEVTIGFCGFFEVTQTYTVYASDEDGAEEAALEEAEQDLEGEVLEDEEDE